jgi:hypothetical protein
LFSEREQRGRQGKKRERETDASADKTRGGRGSQTMRKEGRQKEV